MAFAIGKLRCIRQASPPSRISHCAFLAIPVSESNSESGTPVHSLQLARPWLAAALGAPFGRHSLPEFPEHSRK
jgi:hypothetical protein